MAMESPYADVELPWVAAVYTMAAGVLYMLSGAGVLAEALYNGATASAIACVVLISIGLLIVLLGLDLLINPFRHRALGVAIIIVSSLAFVSMIVTFYTLTGGESVLFVLPVGGIVAGVSAILYESPGID